MLFVSKKSKELKENEERLRKLHEREVRYVTARDLVTNIETIIGKYGYIKIEKDIFSIVCNEKLIFNHSIKGLQGSELMSLDGIILSYREQETGELVEVIAYYKYHRK